MFATIAAEPIPDDFLRLLDSIDASAARQPDSTTARDAADGVDGGSL
jgi:hypothetical protein